MLYINAILHLPLEGMFSYSIPDDIYNIKVGMRVIVPFGKKFYTAIVQSVSTQKPDCNFSLKDIICVLDEQATVSELQLQFWAWVAEYYQASPGDVYQAAVPSGLKIDSAARVALNSDFESPLPLSYREIRLLDALLPLKTANVEELNKVLSIKNCMPALKMLMEKGAVEIVEEITEKVRPKTETYVRLGAKAHNEEELAKFLDGNAKNIKQNELLLKFVELSESFNPAAHREISKKELLRL